MEPIKRLLGRLAPARHPWRTRVGLLGIIDACAGLLLALGYAADTVDPVVAVGGSITALLVNLGIVRGGEALTTPLADPRDSAGRALTADDPDTRQSRDSAAQRDRAGARLRDLLTRRADRPGPLTGQRFTSAPPTRSDIEAEFADRHASTRAILRGFTWGHLPEPFQVISRPICELALDMARNLPDDAELVTGLRKLREAKDCLVLTAVLNPAATDAIRASSAASEIASSTSGVEQSGSSAGS